MGVVVTAGELVLVTADEAVEVMVGVLVGIGDAVELFVAVGVIVDVAVPEDGLNFSTQLFSPSETTTLPVPSTAIQSMY